MEFGAENKSENKQEKYAETRKQTFFVVGESFCGKPSAGMYVLKVAKDYEKSYLWRNSEKRFKIMLTSLWRGRLMEI